MKNQHRCDGTVLCWGYMNILSPTVAVARWMVSLNIMSQREDEFRVNSKAKGSTNAARRAIRVQFMQGGHVLKAIHYFIPNLLAIVRGIYFTHEDTVSVL